MSKRVIFWHRTDLRLKDNLALQAALDLKPAAFYPVWCWDAHYVYQQLVGPNRWQFLLDSMNDVSESYTKLNKKSRLFVVRGHPTTILPALFKDWKITDIVWETDEDGYATERDAAVAKLAEEAGVKVHAVHGHTLWPMEDIKKASKGKISTAYSSFVSAVSSLSEPARPVDAPKSLPDPGPLDLKGWKRDNHSVDKWRKDDVNDELREGGTTDRDQSYESFAGPKGDFAVPTMEELGYTATSSIRGGESRAHKVLDAFMKNKKQVAEFRKPKTSPAAFNPAETTVLSPHHKFGTLSCREFYWRVRDIEKEFKNHSSPPESLIGQILWREFFHANQWSIPNFTEIRGNKLSRFIPWGLQTRYDKDGNKLHRKEMEKIFEKAEPEQLEQFKAWSEGRTGYPWIDGLMRQLRRDGWIHHLGRHSVACFLTRGGLYISWERGAEVFDRFLVDWDPAVNSGNWMWLSASAFFSQYFRVYSPATYGQKSDKTGALIREYVPELAKLPDKYIYEPWKAPADVLKKAGVTLGDNYPHRIVDDKESKEYCLARMKAAYSAGLHGDDKRVLDGTAAEYVAQFLEGKSGKGGTMKADPGSEGEEDSKTRGKRKAPVPKGEKDREGEGKKLKQTKLK